MTEPNTDLPRLAPGTYLLTKRLVVGENGCSEFVDEPVGEYIKGFWPRTRTRVTPVLGEPTDELPLRQRIARALLDLSHNGGHGDDVMVSLNAAADAVLAVVQSQIDRLEVALETQQSLPSALAEQERDRG
ncbi:hypothetical protein BBK82_03555 [Lentzea guizhouensis]|uniref:Uncharacterized protein n=1 Tax=Lentzea guizhouensis TaxID=1586287 RepID=A0A1B2HC58_9PSEU|nr:hypothetical protein [Lentzea guizhouensis]ANZ35292.1 hypothetical protein BBK82_03555 [Lentzea guizhouensis]